MKEKKAGTEREIPYGERLCCFGDGGSGKDHPRPGEMTYSKSRKCWREAVWGKHAASGENSKCKGPEAGVGLALQGAAGPISQSTLEVMVRTLGFITCIMQRHWRVLSRVR